MPQILPELDADADADAAALPVAACWYTKLPLLATRVGEGGLELTTDTVFTLTVREPKLS